MTMPAFANCNRKYGTCAPFPDHDGERAPTQKDAAASGSIPAESLWGISGQLSGLRRGGIDVQCLFKSEQ